LTKGNQPQQNEDRTQSRATSTSALERIRQAAERNKDERFTTLWHHVCDIERLRESYNAQKRNSAAGVDGQTWQEYGLNLEANLQDLSSRLQRGAYRPKPVRRQYIAKDGGRQRPIGIPVLEDKIVQRATVVVLNSIYENDFKGFSYGFRPGRNQHNALDAVSVGIYQKKVNWVLDADIRGFFDSIDHAWLIKFIEHRIADKRVIRHLLKWLKAGVLEDGAKTIAEKGTPQGGSISPLLANIYLHYVLDLWADRWRKRIANGEMIIVRYADDFVVGFQHQNDATKFQAELSERLAKFGLELHETKTRLIEFGRFAANSRGKRGLGKPETFTFLGFTHYCGKTRKGCFTIKRKTAGKKLRAKLQEVKAKLRRNMHTDVGKVGKYLRSVLVGHYRYYAVPGNDRALKTFRFEIFKYWLKMLRRRSQKDRTSRRRVDSLANRWLPYPQIMHPYPNQRLCVKT
jgi:RNA-directed DNA polymerase